MSDLWLLLLVGLPILVAVVLAVAEVIARPDLGPGRTVMWVVALVGVPVIAVAVYAVVRPMRGSRAHAAVTEGSPAAERLVEAAERRQRGEIDDEEFRSTVDAIVAGPPARARRQPS